MLVVTYRRVRTRVEQLIIRGSACDDLSHSAADEPNVQSDGNNAAIVAVRILPPGRLAL